MKKPVKTKGTIIAEKHRDRINRSKGKQHPLHAETLDHLADACEDANYFVVAAIFRAEAKRVRKILR